MKHLEDSLQTTVADFLRAQYPKLLWFCCPNGGKRNAREAGRLKRMGVLPGVADLLLFWPGGMGAIELKVAKNKQTPAQLAFQDKWETLEGYYAVSRSLEEVIAVLHVWGVPK